MMFGAKLTATSAALLELCRSHGVRLATAESCTGGLVSSLLTDIAGSSDVFDRGFVTYSNEAKVGMIGVSPHLILQHGAVSAEVAQAMAEGALKYSAASLSIAITGIAGPGGGSQLKPVGLVFIAAALRTEGDIGPNRISVQRYDFGDMGRAAVRLAATEAAVSLAYDTLAGDP